MFSVIIIPFVVGFCAGTVTMTAGRLHECSNAFCAKLRTLVPITQKVCRFLPKGLPHKKKLARLLCKPVYVTRQKKCCILMNDNINDRYRVLELPIRKGRSVLMRSSL